jgi:hypothetical protein
MFSIFPVIYIFGCFVSVVSFRSFRFGRFVSVISFRSFRFGRFVSVVSFRSFRFDVSPFSTCRKFEPNLKSSPLNFGSNFRFEVAFQLYSFRCSGSVFHEIWRKCSNVLWVILFQGGHVMRCVTSLQDMCFTQSSGAIEWAEKKFFISCTQICQ